MAKRFPKLALSTTTRRYIVFTYDLLAIGIAFCGAFLLRFDFRVPPDMIRVLKGGILEVYAIQAAVFIGQGLYRGLWSFASLRDLFLIIRAVSIGVVLSVCTLAIFNNHLIGWPRSVFFLDEVLLILAVGGGRFTYRVLREHFLSSGRKKRNILIIGCGQSANLIAREFRARPELSARTVGYLDDDPQLRGTRIHGATVLGPISTLHHWLRKLRPEEIIIAIPSLPGNRVKEIIAEGQKLNIPCRICPPIRDVLLGRVRLNQLREVRVEDLLRRDVVRVNDAGIKSLVEGRDVLITGAGGSIGSELCRQVLRYRPKRLVLFERSEYNLYKFEQEVRRDQLAPDGVDVRFVVGDILDECRLRQVMSDCSPEIVLHAAAYKHVPLMEENLYEAIRNNVLGTYRLSLAARDHGVKTFVLISTDKAVRPASIMGASKRMAELVAHAVAQNTSMKSVAVRFGNVLDSEGSVLPLFKEQIARGGPVTVTHPNVTRYFMTIPEASQLVLQASQLGEGGEVFLLDMGEPVLIVELAEDLIRLSGLKPQKDIDIVFTGLRKGEKLHEELLFDMTQARPTSHPKIVVSTEEQRRTHLPEGWDRVLREFAESATPPTEREIVEWISDWVPDFSLAGDSATESHEESDSSSAYAIFPAVSQH